MKPLPLLTTISFKGFTSAALEKSEEDEGMLADVLGGNSSVLITEDLTGFSGDFFSSSPFFN